MQISITSLGGAGTVTGSKHLLDFGSGRLLVDCGLFQGTKALRELNWEGPPVDPRSIDGVVLTHAHLDHTGYLPRLVKDGFRGPIYATPATIDVSKLILLDSAFLQEKDAELANRYGYSRHKPALPLYGKHEAQLTFELFQPVEFHKSKAVARGAELLFRRAGHILGAATAEIRVGDRVILFSGDLGRFNDPVLPDPELVPEADCLVIESTYGNRLHDVVDAATELGDVVERTVKRGGTIIIPAFAVGRAQSLLYYFWRLRKAGRLSLVPIFVDSPMAINATDLLCRHPADHKLGIDACGATCNVATYVRDVEASKKLSRDRMPKVIISASGMATGGRVLHHIKAFGGDPANTLLFSGFQAAGTRGRALVDGQREVRIHGDSIRIRAEVANLPALSAHADANELLRWMGGLRQPPSRTIIVHGEPDAAAALQSRVERELGWPCVIPEQGQRITVE